MSAAALPQPGNTAPAGLIPLIRSLVINLAGPWAVYSLAAPYFPAGSTSPLLLSTLPSLAEFAVQYVRQRSVDVIAVISLIQLAVSIAIALFAHTTALATAGHALMPTVLGLVFGASILIGRPLIRPLARQTMAGKDADRQVRFDARADLPRARHIFNRITLIWAGTLCIEGFLLLAAALQLPVGTYLLVSNILGNGVLAALIWGGIAYGRAAVRAA